MLRTLTILSVALSLGCTSPSDAQRFAEVEPFRTLGVSLGITPESLQVLRPAATLAKYGGMQEQTKGGYVVYTFPGTEERLPTNAHLTVVSIGRSFAKDTVAARAELLREKQRIASQLGAPMKCGIVVFPFIVGDLAEWTDGPLTITVGLWTDKDSVRLVHALQRPDGPRTYSEARTC
jgi:hypothetical protein